LGIDCGIYKNKTGFSKYKSLTTTGDMVQAAEHLSLKHQALGSISNTTQNKTNNKKL
jgi:septation ring formation regulator EzrA